VIYPLPPGAVPPTLHFIYLRSPEAFRDLPAIPADIPSLNGQIETLPKPLAAYK
jgi:hypothetical protein